MNSIEAKAASEELVDALHLLRSLVVSLLVIVGQPLQTYGAELKKYKVFVHGENFLLAVEQRSEKIGFFVTCFVEAPDPQKAEHQAIAVLRQDPELNKMVRNDVSDSPMMTVEEIEELASFEGFPTPRTGFAFYPAKNAEPHRMPNPK